MTDTLLHRGPDGGGHYVDRFVGLGHRRLSILDLSDAGAQPMCNEDGTVWIVFNGEIYNFHELRRRLVDRGHVFRSTCDTEVIVHLYEEHGADCVSLLRGMFAFAIWDSRRERLVIARDRVGIKPLYYRDTGRALIFASEVKALLVEPHSRAEVNVPAIDRLFTHHFSPGTETLFKGIVKLKPAHLLTIDRSGVQARQFWELQFGERPALARGGFSKAAEELDDLLRGVTKDHMISDVPVGFLASGGVDSTALLSYAAELTEHRVSTFTVGFSGENFADERPFARAASDRFGTSHYETSISADDFRAFLSDYVWHIEEPVCEPPAIALHYVTKLARQHVKVLLSGEGGDEAFGGYPEYRSILWIERLKRLPRPARILPEAFLRSVAQTQRFSRLGRYVPLLSMPLSDYYYSRISSPVTKDSPFKRDLYSSSFLAEVNGSRREEYVHEFAGRGNARKALDQMLFIDTKTWLPDDLLVKADKMTMANSVELRVPFLDHKVLEFAAGLPSSWKVNGFGSKRVLKHAFRKRVPHEILTRKKTGFPVPFAKWLTNDLQEFVRDTLTSSKALSRGYFSPAGIDRLFQAQNSTRASDLFTLTVLELWHQRFVDYSGVEGAAQIAA